MFHRWLARLLLVFLAPVHILGRVYVNVPAVTPGSDDWQMVKWGCGAAACFLAVNITGMRWFRTRWFSVFIFVHVVSIFSMIACMLMHYPAYAGLVWAGLALYLLDHLWRAGRIIFYYGIRSAYHLNDTRSAWVEALTDDTMRVNVRTRMDWTAGSHVYLHLPFLSQGGHPFR